MEERSFKPREKRSSEEIELGQAIELSVGHGPPNPATESWCLPQLE